MNALQSVIKVCLLFILLSVLAVIPMGITNIQNKKLINQVHTTNIQKEEQMVYRTLNIKQKLSIIVSSTGVTQTKVFNESHELDNIFNEMDKDKELGNMVVEQLKLLQQLEVIPPIDLTREFTIKDLSIKDLSKLTYLDLNKPQNIVNIIELTMVFQDCNISVWIDLDTPVLYQVDIVLKEGSPRIITDIRPLLYMEYLGLPSENVSFKGDEYGHLIVYTDESLRFAYQFNSINGYSYSYSIRAV